MHSALSHHALRAVWQHGARGRHYSVNRHGPPFARVADAIALIGIFATARVFQSLAAMDIGTAFGSMGARREMMVGFLAEPALLMVLFNAFLLSGSTALPSLVEAYSSGPRAINPSLTFAGIAFVMVLLAENARIPIDNPSTHLELTMIHEAMVLEYSGRHLALIEWASSLKLFNYACIGFALFCPGNRHHGADGGWALLLAAAALIAKLIVSGAALALIESLSPSCEFFALRNFWLRPFAAVLGLLVHLLLGHDDASLALDRRIAQPAGQHPAAHFLCHALATPHAAADYAVRLAGFGSVRLHLLVAYSSGLKELYYSAALTLLLKVIVLPWVLYD